MRFKEFLLENKDLARVVAGMYVAAGPLKDGMYKVTIKKGYNYSRKPSVLARAMAWMTDRDYDIFDEQKNPVTEFHNRTDRAYYVRPTSMFKDMFDGDDEAMKKKLGSIHTLVSPNKVFEDLDEVLYEAEYQDRNQMGDGYDFHESVEKFPVRRDDIEILGPDEHGMWTVQLKDFKITSSRQLESARWHLHTLKRAVGWILQTDYDDEVDMYTIPFLPNVAPDAFKIERMIHIPDNMIGFRVRPKNILPKLYQGDDEELKRKLARRVAAKEDANVRHMLEKTILAALDSANDDYNHYMNPLDDNEVF